MGAGVTIPHADCPRIANRTPAPVVSAATVAATVAEKASAAATVTGYRTQSGDALRMVSARRA